MMAKITKGSSFGGCVRYALLKEDAQLIGAYGVLYNSHRTITESFNAQAGMNPRLETKVGHISLNFSEQDKERVDNAFMLKTALEYMRKMGIADTQFIVVRHNDRDHPHCHIVFNRVSNSGKTISDRNDRLRSVKVCRELTEKYGLYLNQAEGKQNVKRERLLGPDKIKYEIYDAVKKALPHCSGWNELEKRLKSEGIAVTYKFKGATGQREGVIFSKAEQSFNGSKIDRRFSFSKLDAALRENGLRRQAGPGNAQAAGLPDSMQKPQNHTVTDMGDTGIGSLLNFRPNPVYEPDDELFRRLRKKKKKNQINLER